MKRVAFAYITKVLDFDTMEEAEGYKKAHPEGARFFYPDGDGEIHENGAGGYSVTVRTPLNSRYQPGW